MKLELRTGARLHFGLMELCQKDPRCYAGLGVMIEDPQIRIRLRSQAHPVDAKCGTRSDRKSCEQATQTQTQIGAGRASTKQSNSNTASRTGISRMDAPQHLLRKINALPAFRHFESSTLAGSPSLTVDDAFDLHAGLGTGTQSACAVTAALYLWNLFCTKEDLQRHSSWESVCEALSWDATNLSTASGRGLRSAIGLQGFVSGGLIWDEGRVPYDHSVFQASGDSTLDTASFARHVQTQRFELPAEWRIVTLRPRQHKPAISGASESSIIDGIGERRNPDQDRMWDLAAEVGKIVESQSSLQEFAKALDEYMRLAGNLFSAVQNGSYSSETSAELAELALRHGLCAVGQSSWGPTVFGFAEDPQRAEQIAAQIRDVSGTNTAVQVTRPNNSGAQFRWS